MNAPQGAGGYQYLWADKGLYAVICKDGDTYQVKLLLKLLICVVDTKLFKAVDVKCFKAEDKTKITSTMAATDTHIIKQLKNKVLYPCYP